MVDKNLFPHNLAVVAIMKNEGAYLKEWLDYHILAGVDHFYLYDNDSTDNQAEVAKPYVAAGLVDYFHASGKMMHYVAYNDAVKRFKFHCRYMAFIDADEFIYPKTNQSIVETLDEILTLAPEAAGVAVNWQFFGSNGHETADLSRGVLERFTRRAPSDWAPDGYGGNAHIKTVANPRYINFIEHSHHPRYFDDLHSVNEKGKVVPEWCNFPVTVDKLALNHYYTRSREEFLKKVRRGNSDLFQNMYKVKDFDAHDRNEVFDDGILKYRATRAQNFSLPNSEQKLQRVTETLTKILSDEKFSMETALTCRELSNHLGLKVHEEASLGTILNSLDKLSLVDMQLFARDLPNLLYLPYPAAKYLREIALQIVPYLMGLARLNQNWQRYVELDYLSDILKHGG